MKSEPSCYSIDDLKRQKIGMWDGVRNYQARNFMRQMKREDGVLFYHSSAEEIGVVGMARVAREAYPDPTQFKKGSEHYDPKSKKESPRWDAVDVRFESKFAKVVTLGVLKNDPFFETMIVIKPGVRLSIQPISKKHFDRIVRLGGEGRNKISP